MTLTFSFGRRLSAVLSGVINIARLVTWTWGKLLTVGGQDMYIRNSNEYQVMFNAILVKVLQDAADWLLVKLRNQIYIDVYNHSKSVNAWYYDGSGIPTWEFLNAWKLSPIRTRLRTSIFMELYIDTGDLSYDEDTWLHGSYLNGDVRESLADILNLAYNGYQPGYASPLAMTPKRKPYWNNFIKKWVESGKLQERITKKLKGELGSKTQIVITGRKAVSE